MQLHVAAAVTDFWGIVFPAYLGAIGTIASGAVAAIAIITSARNSAGVRNIAQSINDETPTVNGYRPPDGWAPLADPLSTVYVADHFKWGVVNRSRDSVTLTGLEILSDGVKVTFSEGLPIEVPSGGTAEYDVHRGLVGPTSAQMRVSWRTEDGKTGESNLLV